MTSHRSSAVSKSEGAPGAGARKAPAARSARLDTAAADEAKHRRAAEMARQLRLDAEALSASADRLLSRLS